MKTLFIDTHYRDLIIILFENKKIVNKYEFISITTHSTKLIPTIKALLDENNLLPSDLSEIIVVNGPGSFTGVRLGVTVAKTMAYLLNIPIKTVTSLQVLATQVDKTKFIVSNEENNGSFIGIFNDSFINPEYKYLKASEIVTYVTTNHIETIENIDYEKMINKLDELPYCNPHLVNPIYVKVIEVQNDKKSRA